MTKHLAPQAISGVYSLQELQTAITCEPEKWRPLVFTNGCFDLIHAGHIRYLQAAKALGHCLIIGLNSDLSVQSIKPQRSGLPSRPIVPEMQRAEVLTALKPVDGVVIFAETTANYLLESIKPDIYVKGGDYQLETLPEAPVVKRLGIEVVFIQVEVPCSTSAIIQQILTQSS